VSGRWPIRPFRDRNWLEREYVESARSARDIASQFGVHENAILWWLTKHKIPRRNTSEVRRMKRWGAAGPDNPMFNKRGAANPNWRGGISPERQGFYASFDWKQTVRAVWKRDEARCQRCNSKAVRRSEFHIHHIVSFAIRELRTELTNLVLLCTPCHQWVHSRSNVASMFLDPQP
jgi:hypothetical protein